MLFYDITGFISSKDDDSITKEVTADLPELMKGNTFVWHISLLVNFSILTKC